MCDEYGPRDQAVPDKDSEGEAKLGREGGGYFPTFRRVGQPMVRRLPGIGQVARKLALVLLKALLVSVILLGVLHIAATVYLGHRVKTELHKIAAAGEIVNFMDGVPPPVPANENAALVYLKAAAILEQRDRDFTATHPQTAQRGERYDINFADPVELAALTPMLRQDGDVLEVLRRATTMPRCRFDTNWEDVFGALFPHYAKMRRMARFLRAAVVEAALRGDAAEALERARIGFVLSRRMLQDPSLLIGQLVAYAIDAVITRGVMCVVEKGHVPEEAAKQLAQELAKDDLVGAFVKSMQMERAGGIWFFDQLRRKPREILGMVSWSEEAADRAILKIVATRIGRPFLYANELGYLHMMEDTIQTARRPWREAGWYEQQARAEKVCRWTPLAGMIAPVFTRAAAKRDEAIAMRAMMVTALAIEVYRQRTGRLPESLAELKVEVPWATTDDVFSGRALVYRPKDGTYLLYSVGPNLKDDSGEPMDWQKKLLGLPPSRLARDPDPGDLVWLPQLWRPAPR